MHVISQDFNSDALKKKKHWNSFTTEFFISANDFIKKFEAQKSMKFDKSEYEPLLEGPMKCHRCHKVIENIPKLKNHISTCKG